LVKRFPPPKMAEGYNWMWAKQTSSNGQSLSIRGVSRQIGLFGYPDVTCRDKRNEEMWKMR